MRISDWSSDVCSSDLFLYAGSGIVGALAGSTIGKAIDGQKLLFLFALLMLVVGVLMLRGRDNPGIEGPACHRHSAPKVLGHGLGTGGFSGYFVMCGGLLFVTGRLASTTDTLLTRVGPRPAADHAIGLSTALEQTESQ